MIYHNNRFIWVKSWHVFFLYVVLFFFLFFPTPVHSKEIVVLKIIVNGEVKGDFFVIMSEGGDFLLKTSDIRDMGIIREEGKVSEIKGEKYVSLGSIDGINFTFNENTLTLDISVEPVLLPRQTIDLLPFRRPDVLYTEDSSVFFNYRFYYSENNEYDLRNLDFVNELGIRNGNFLFLSDFLYTSNSLEEKFVRLMSSITYDKRHEMERVIVGDFFASSWALGSTLNIGGVSYSKIFSMDPYFNPQPVLNISGLTSLPSDVEVYLDGTKIKSGKLQPGAFELQNISYYSGAHDIDVVLRDPFERETVISRSFYFTDTLLKKGLHEYSYNIGFLRDDFGIESNGYGDPAFSAFHKYGISDMFNAGVRTEGTDNMFNFGTQVSFRLGTIGLFSTELSVSADEGESGMAVLLNYVYQKNNFAVRGTARGYSEEYSTIETSAFTEKSKYELSAGLGYGTREIGSFSLSAAVEKKYEGRDMQIFALSYTKSLSHNSTLYMTFRDINSEDNSFDFFIGLNYYFGKDYSFSARYQQGDDSNTQAVQAQKNPPVGKGYGFSITAERLDIDSRVYKLNPSAQYKTDHGVYRGSFMEYCNDTDCGSVYDLSAAGALVYIGNTFGLTRPVTDSFGLIKVGDLDSVTVYVNNQEEGKTDKTGKTFVTDIHSYNDNSISIEDKEIPVNYSIDKITMYVSPPQNSGFYLEFDIHKIQAITGRLRMSYGDATIPVEFQEISMDVEGNSVVFPTGRDGEFYLENIKPGIYTCSFRHFQKRCSFDIMIPSSDKMVIDVGEIICENIN